MKKLILSILMVLPLLLSCADSVSNILVLDFLDSDNVSIPTDGIYLPIKAEGQVINVRVMTSHEARIQCLNADGSTCEYARFGSASTEEGNESLILTVEANTTEGVRYFSIVATNNGGSTVSVPCRQDKISK